LYGSRIGRLGGRRLAGLPVAFALGAALPAVAEAAPEITQPPVIGGQLHVGGTLTATAGGWSGGGAPSYTWVRCRSAAADVCRIIEGATGTSYVAVRADRGRQLRVLLSVVDGGERDDVISEATPRIERAPGAPPEPEPEPEPEPDDEPEPEDESGEVIDPSAYPPPPFETAGPPPAAPPAGAPTGQPASPRLISPFPVVRVRGRLTRTGARVTLLTVRAPRGARISVRCRGRTCPRRRYATAAGVRRLRAFERTLRAGLRLEIRVTRPGFIGKHTLLRIRRGRAPLRRDRCLMPGSTRPTRCPA